MQILFIMFKILSFKCRIQHQYFTILLIATWVVLNTSPVDMYIVIVEYEYKIYLINLIYLYCTATWKSMLYFNRSLDFFFLCHSFYGYTKEGNIF